MGELQSAATVVLVRDGSAGMELLLLTPQEAIARHQRQEIDLMPPTFVSISRFIGYSTVAEALASVPDGEPPLFESFVVTIDDRPTIVWTGDPEHPTSKDTNGRHRLGMGDRPWVFERVS